MSHISSFKDSGMFRKERIVSKNKGMSIYRYPSIKERNPNNVKLQHQL